MTWVVPPRSDDLVRRPAYDGMVPWPQSRPYLRDIALAFVLTAASLVAGAGLYLGGPGQRKLLVTIFGDQASMDRALMIWWLCGSLLLAALLIRNRWPFAALVLAGLGAAGHQLDPRFGVQPLDLVLPIVLYTVASRAVARWVSGVTIAVAVAGGYLISLYAVLSSTNKAWEPKQALTPILDAPVPAALVRAAGESFQVLLVLVLAVALGDGVRSRRQHLRAVQQRAEDLEREQQQHAALAAAAERARIVRELHDVVAHGLSVIVVQAQGAAAAMQRRPERAALAIQQVITTGRDALSEMRRLLGVVMQDPGADVRPVPEPGLETLEKLVDTVNGAGLRVRLEITGDRVALPPLVDRSLYRIVQEALTNAMKHAGSAARAQVAVRFADGHVDITVSDDGVGGAVAAGQGGHGLRGIAERVALLGGNLSAGPLDAGGFQVRATLPLIATDVPAGVRR